MRSSSALLSAREGISDRLEARCRRFHRPRNETSPPGVRSLAAVIGMRLDADALRTRRARLARNRQKLRPVPFRRARVPRLRTSAAQRPRRGFGRAAAATLRPRLLECMYAKGHKIPVSRGYADSKESAQSAGVIARPPPPPGQPPAEAPPDYRAK